MFTIDKAREVSIYLGYAAQHLRSAHDYHEFASHEDDDTKRAADIWVKMTINSAVEDLNKALALGGMKLAPIEPEAIAAE